MSLPTKKFKDGFKDRLVFVTGAGGFIGSHLTGKLLGYGAKVHVFVRASSSGQLGNIAHLRDNLVIHRGDLGDKHSIMGALEKLGGASKLIVFHLAAQAHVGESWQRPYETIASNVLGTVNLLQSLADLKMDLFKVVVAGSSEEYGNILPEMKEFYRFKEGALVLDERSPLNPQSVYAVSKVATDFVARAYGGAYQLPVVTSRMFNNYGPRQNPRFITGTIITQALTRDEIALGYLKAKRDFCYCEDGARGHMTVALWGKAGEVYVYGHGRNITIGDWCQLILSVGRKEGFWKGEKRVVTNDRRDRLGSTEVEELLVDYSKLHDLTGWTPTFSWEEGLKRTIQWYAENKEKWISRVTW